MATEITSETLGKFSSTNDVVAYYSDAATALNGISTIIVTGSNTGIGKQTAFALAKLGAIIILGCRNIEKGQNARNDILNKLNVNGSMNNVHFIQLDLGSLSSISSFVKEFNHKTQKENWPPLTHLICNAGLFPMTNTISFNNNITGMENTFAISHLGHYYLTKLLLPNLRRTNANGGNNRNNATRVIMVSSGSHYGPLLTKDMTSKKEVLEKIVYPSSTLTSVSKKKNMGGMGDDDNTTNNNKYSGTKCYGSSKLCNAIFAKALYEREKDNNIHCASLHPGSLIATDIARDNFFANLAFKYIISWFTKTIDQGCSTTLACCLMPVEQLKGQYFDDCQVKNPGKMVYNKKAGDVLWEISEEILTNVGFGSESNLNRRSSLKMSSNL